MPRLEFELAYDDVVVQYVRHSTTGTTALNEGVRAYKKISSQRRVWPSEEKQSCQWVERRRLYNVRTEPLSQDQDATQGQF